MQELVDNNLRITESCRKYNLLGRVDVLKEKTTRHTTQRSEKSKIIWSDLFFPYEFSPLCKNLVILNNIRYGKLLNEWRRIILYPHA